MIKKIEYVFFGLSTLSITEYVFLTNFRTNGKHDKYHKKKKEEG